MIIDNVVSSYFFNTTSNVGRIQRRTEISYFDHLICWAIKLYLTSGIGLQHVWHEPRWKRKWHCSRKKKSEMNVAALKRIILYQNWGCIRACMSLLSERKFKTRAWCVCLGLGERRKKVLWTNEHQNRIERWLQRSGNQLCFWSTFTNIQRYGAVLWSVAMHTYGFNLVGRLKKQPLIPLASKTRWAIPIHHDRSLRRNSA